MVLLLPNLPKKNLVSINNLRIKVFLTQQSIIISALFTFII